MTRRILALWCLAANPEGLTLAGLAGAVGDKTRMGRKMYCTQLGALCANGLVCRAPAPRSVGGVYRATPAGEAYLRSINYLAHIGWLSRAFTPYTSTRRPAKRPSDSGRPKVKRSRARAGDAPARCISSVFALGAAQ